MSVHRRALRRCQPADRPDPGSRSRAPSSSRSSRSCLVRQHRSTGVALLLLTLPRSRRPTRQDGLHDWVSTLQAASARVVAHTLGPSDPDAGVWTLGIVCGLIHDIPSCKDLCEKMSADAGESPRCRAPNRGPPLTTHAPMQRHTSTVWPRSPCVHASLSRCAAAMLTLHSQGGAQSASSSRQSHL